MLPPLLVLVLARLVATGDLWSRLWAIKPCVVAVVGERGEKDEGREEEEVGCSSSAMAEKRFGD